MDDTIDNYLYETVENILVKKIPFLMTPLWKKRDLIYDMVWNMRMIIDDKYQQGTTTA